MDSYYIVCNYASENHRNKKYELINNLKFKLNNISPSNNKKSIDDYFKNGNKKPKQEILNELYKIIIQANFIFVLLDENTNSSSYCANEIRYALGIKKPIIFLKLKNKISKINYPDILKITNNLSRFQFIRYRLFIKNLEMILNNSKKTANSNFKHSPYRTKTRKPKYE